MTVIKAPDILEDHLPIKTYIFCNHVLNILILTVFSTLVLRYFYFFCGN